LNKKYSTENILCWIIYIFILNLADTNLFCKSNEFSIHQINSFRLKGADGEVYEKKDLKGKQGIIIMFLSNHCKYSQIYVKYLNDWNKQWKKDGFNLFVFSPNHEKSILPNELAFTPSGDSYKEMVEKHKEHIFNYPFIYDGDDHIVTNSLNATITPSVYLFNKEGSLVYSGRIGNHENPSDKSESELHLNIQELLSKKDFKFNRTRTFGKAIRFKSDLESAEKIKKRYAQETVNLYYANEKKIDLLISHNTSRPTFFYVWSLGDKEEITRENLIVISKNFKIFRKRGIKVITICIAKEEEKERINNLLDICQLSAFNYYTYVSDVKNLIKLRIEGHQTITPFGRLMRTNGKMGYATLGEIEDKKMHIEFLDSLEKE
jgi:peroxiredoxin